MILKKDSFFFHLLFTTLFYILVNAVVNVLDKFINHTDIFLTILYFIAGLFYINKKYLITFCIYIVGIFVFLLLRVRKDEVIFFNYDF